MMLSATDELHDQALHQPVFGHVGDPGPHRVLDRGDAHRPAFHQDLPAVGGADAEQRVGQLGAARTDQARDADDLPRAQLEGDVLEIVPLGKPAHLQEHPLHLA